MFWAVTTIVRIAGYTVGEKQHAKDVALKLGL